MRLSYVPAFYAEGHDPDCAAHSLEPCDCVSGIIQTIKLAFAQQLAALAQPSPLDTSGRVEGGEGE